ncbi:MAG TPA: hypothetical protein VKF62_13525 [Planctomycetota bacterium]|nr:hypothetical protein [Planctomycetota bacterium]
MPASPEAALRTARVIAIALIGGCALFAGVVVYLRGERTGTEGMAGVFSLIGWILAGTQFVLSFVFRGRRPEEPFARATHAFTRTIVAVALNEGAVFLNLTFSLVTGSLAPFLYAAAIGFAGLLLHFPTRERFGVEP